MEPSSAPLWDALQAELRAAFEESYNSAMDQYVDQHVIGSTSQDWQPQGLICPPSPANERTPVDRAMAMLAPHLVHDPRYQP